MGQSNKSNKQVISISSREASLRRNVMDAYILGALPPYNALLGGKMVACLIRSREVYNEFSRTYGNTSGIISGKAKKARLLAVTTSSSMGRSSVYNRLKLGGVRYFEPIGYTRGWGHFHISDDLFLELRDYLRSIGHQYADQHRFGQAPTNHARRAQGARIQRRPRARTVDTSPRPPTSRLPPMEPVRSSAIAQRPCRHPVRAPSVPDRITGSSNLTRWTAMPPH